MAHGGDRYRNRVLWDFSVNLNPLGVPESLRQAMQRGIQEAEFYPDPLQEAEKHAAAQFYSGRTGVPLGSEDLILGNGASELILAVFRALRPEHVLIPAPSYTGYVRAAGDRGTGDRETGGRAAGDRNTGDRESGGRAVGDRITGDRKAKDRENGGVIRFYPTREDQGFQTDPLFPEQIGRGTDLLVLTNPGNPAGGMTDPELLRRILTEARKYRIPVLLDECFIEFTGREKDSGILLLDEFPELMILRAFTKIFSLPGLRLGTLLLRNETLRDRIERELPEWNLSAPAGRVMITAAEEREELYRFMDQTADETRRLRGILMEILGKWTTRIYPSKANYLLTRGMGQYADKLLDRGILVRRCKDIFPLGPEYLRFAVRPEAELLKLREALE